MSGRVVLDTNIIIYLSKKLLQTSKVFVADTTYFLSVISKMELLGYPFQNKIEEEYLLEIIDSMIIVPLSEDIVNLTIGLRKKHKVKLPDAIIYATAQKLKAKLLTNNISDFDKIIGTVEIVNPLD